MSSYEFLGVFGFSWQERMAKNMGYPVTVLNASNYGWIVTGMNRRYQLYKKQGLDTDDMVSKIAYDTNQSEDMVRRFLDEMVKKEQTGTVLPKSAERKEAAIPLVTAEIVPSKLLTPLVVGAVAIAAIMYGPAILNMIKRRP